MKNEKETNNNDNKVIRKSLGIVISYIENIDYEEDLGETVNSIKEAYNNHDSLDLTIYLVSNEKNADLADNNNIGFIPSNGRVSLELYNDAISEVVEDNDWFMFLSSNSRVDKTFFNDIRIYFSTNQDSLSLIFNVKINDINYASAKDNSLYGRIFNCDLFKKFNINKIPELPHFAYLAFNGYLNTLASDNKLNNNNMIQSNPYIYYEVEDLSNELLLDKSKTEPFFVNDYIYAMNLNIDIEDKSHIVFILLTIYFANQYIKYMNDDEIILRVNDSYARESFNNTMKMLRVKSIIELDRAVDNFTSIYNNAREYSLNLFGNFIESQSIFDWILS